MDAGGYLREYEKLHIENLSQESNCITVKEVKKILKNNKRKSS